MSDLTLAMLRESISFSVGALIFPGLCPSLMTAALIGASTKLMHEQGSFYFANYLNLSADISNALSLFQAFYLAKLIFGINMSSLLLIAAVGGVIVQALKSVIDLCHNSPNFAHP
jgi:hypothetical protein